MIQPRRLFDVRGHLVAIAARHADVGEDDVGRIGVQTGDSLIAVAHGDHLDILVGEGQLDDSLNRNAVVGKQKLMGHFGPIGSSGGCLQFRILNSEFRLARGRSY